MKSLLFYFSAFIILLGLFSCSYRRAHSIKFNIFNKVDSNLYSIESCDLSPKAVYTIIFSGDLKLEDVTAGLISIKIENKYYKFTKDINPDKIFKCNWAKLNGETDDHYNNLGIKLSFTEENKFQSFDDHIEDARIDLKAITSEKVYKVYLMQTIHK